MNPSSVSQCPSGLKGSDTDFFTQPRCETTPPNAKNDSSCGGKGQRACCVGEQSFGACKSGLAEVAGCKGGKTKCQCGKGSSFQSSGRCEVKKETPGLVGPSEQDYKDGKKSLDELKYDQDGKDKTGGTGAIDLDDEKDDDTPADCTEATCKPYSKKNEVGWSRELGDSKIIAAYTGFTVTSRHPDANTAGCQLSWDNSLYMLKKKVPLLKFTAAGQAETAGSASMSGSAKLDLMGKTYWHGEGSLTSKELTRQFRTEKLSVSYTIYKVINFNAEMDAGATVGLIPASAQETDDDGAECTITVKPGLTTDLTAKVSVSIGPKGIFELIKGGIAVRIIPLKVGIPITVGVEVDPDPISIDLIFKTKFEVSLLEGEIFLFYDIWDTCKIPGVTFCLFKELKIKTHGEKRLYKSKKGAYSYAKTLANINQKLNFKKVASAKN